MNDVILTVTGIHMTEDPEAEKIEFITEGKMYQKGNSIYLVYRESELSGMEGSATTVKVTGEKAVMMRYNKNQVLNTKIEFEKERLYNGYYSTPFGSVEMNVRTDTVDNRLSAETGGSLHIEYDMELVGLSKGRNILEMNVQKGAQ